MSRGKPLKVDRRPSQHAGGMTLTTCRIFLALALSNSLVAATSGPDYDVANVESWKLAVGYSNFEDVPELLEEARKVHSGKMLVLRKHGVGEVRLQDLIALTNFDTAACNENYKNRLEVINKLAKESPFYIFTKKSLDKWALFCTNVDASKMLSEFTSLSQKTKEFLKIFSENDNSWLDSYHKPSQSFLKLRDLLELDQKMHSEFKDSSQESKEERMKKRASEFLRACSEVTSALKSVSSARVLNFCLNLVNFDYSIALHKALTKDVKAWITIGLYGKQLELLSNKPQQETGKERLALWAAFDFARVRLQDHIPRPTQDDLMAETEQLLQSCRVSLHAAKDLLWLREVSSEHNVQDQTLAPRVLMYLKKLASCRELVETATETIREFIGQAHNELPHEEPTQKKLLVEKEPSQKTEPQKPVPQKPTAVTMEPQRKKRRCWNCFRSGF